MEENNKSLADFRNFILAASLPTERETVNNLLLLALHKYRKQQMSTAYLEYSLFPQLLPLLQADQVNPVRGVLERYGQTVD
ncbi:hypothetical protein [Loigolactobacillus iwatensis]|uniref:hypothetical protein n=1 Tax=Loigolactobacillus iwatensis TaxID=1267156 RepID=UPI000F7D71E8|nr:hypothetical protein [Loigolactobacillus iwatensis]